MFILEIQRVGCGNSEKRRIVVGERNGRWSEEPYGFQNERSVGKFNLGNMIWSIEWRNNVQNGFNKTWNDRDVRTKGSRNVKKELVMVLWWEYQMTCLHTTHVFINNSGTLSIHTKSRIFLPLSRTTLFNYLILSSFSNCNIFNII